jgi:hypothetical protein
MLNAKDGSMFEITAYTVESVPDKFGIITGKRYEFMLEIEVSEEDELYSEDGLFLRVIYKEDEGRTGIVKYEFIERSTSKYLDFELDDEETAFVESFCKERYMESEDQD